MVHYRKLQLGLSANQQAINRVCIALFIAVWFATTYRFLWLEGDDRYGCGALLNRGRWLYSSWPDNEPSFRNWQPPGCMMHEYDVDDISACLKSRSIVFVGDSTTRSIFWATARKLNSSGAAQEEILASKHEDQSFSGAGVTVKFIWDPFLNSSSLHAILTSYRENWGSKGEKANKKGDPAIILIGGGLWHAKHLVVTYLDEFKVSMDKVVSFMNSGGSGFNSSLEGFWRRRISSNLMAIAPVQVPSYEALPPLLQETLSPPRIESLNNYLQQISSTQGASVVWSYYLMTSHADSAYDGLGIHINGDIASRKADLLLNMKCNEKLMKSENYPMDKTCCARYPRPSWVQLIVVVGSLAIVMFTKLSSLGKPEEIVFLPSRISHALSPLASALCYCFFADRTHIFSKAQKEYSFSEFRLLCLVTLTLGILSIRRSSSPVQKIKNQSFLSRDQTDEWKGWMQFIILIYHYTGASKKLEIYAVIRILVASYLYMTGFGHTVFFYQKRDYSLHRCASVLVRLNLLSIVLPYVMRTDYLFYYFAPLISFWYLVIYFTMRIGNNKNTSILFLIGKIATSAALTTFLIRTPGIFEKIFSLLEKICRIRWNVTEWRFRLQLDAYIVYVGMICGILSVKISSILEGEHIDVKFFSLIRRHWLSVRRAAIGIALMTLPSFWHLARQSQNKHDYNQWVPFISCLPILSFVILRNSSRYTRNFYSSIFAWLGRHSLETFTLQFHIWLAADTKGLLALGIFGRNQDYIDGRWPDFVLLTVLFLWVSWHVAAATTSITSWIIDPSVWRSEEADSKLELPLKKRQAPLDGHVKDKVDQGNQRGRLFWLLEDLRVRLAIMLGVLWCLNLVSYPEKIIRSTS